MNRQILVVALFAAASAALLAQQSNSATPYQGTSNPPPDDSIITDADQPQPQAKPRAGHPIGAPADSSPHSQSPQAAPADSGSVPASSTTAASSGPELVQRVHPALNLGQTTEVASADPDGDIVHPAALGPGELREGTTIRVRLLSAVSSSLSEQGEPFRSRVATDVLEAGNVVIPAGAEISGKVVDVSSGHLGGHGTLMLRPDTVTLPNGQSFRLHATVSGAPGTHTKVGAEGVISPDSRLKRDGIEYGAAMGGGAATGAILGGPVGALAGTIVGAGVVTTHLLVSHPQAHLEPGDVLMLTLTERVHLDPAAPTGN
jgi:hypothetical protein